MKVIADSSNIDEILKEIGGKKGKLRIYYTNAPPSILNIKTTFRTYLISVLNNTANRRTLIRAIFEFEDEILKVETPPCKINEFKTKSLY